MRFADVLTRIVDRILFGPPAPQPRQWTPRRYDRLVAERAVVDEQPVTVVDRVFPENGEA